MARSKTLSVEVKPRTCCGTSASRRLRREGMVPAVLYGHGAEVKTFVMSDETADAVLHHPGLMSLTVDGAETATAILKAAQRHPVNDGILHVDFLAVRADEVIRSMVPVKSTGTPKGATAGGQLEQVLHMLEIECLPGDLPEHVEVDVSGMELDVTMHVREIPMPEGTKAVSDGGLAVFQVRLPKIEEVKEEAPAAAEGAEAAEAAEAAAEGAEAGEKAEKGEKGEKTEKADKKAGSEKKEAKG